MNYTCQICAASCDEIGNPGAVVDPLAKTMLVTCIKCRLAACAERSRGRPQTRPATVTTAQYKGQIQTGKLPYKDS